MGKADLHLHTTASDGMMSPAMLMNYIAACTDLDLVAITDRNTLDGWAKAREFQLRPQNDHLHDLELVPGVEVSTREGDLLGIGVSRAVPRDMSAAETIMAIHEQGGVALAPHPFAWMPGLKDFAGVRRRFLVLPLDGVEVRNSNATEFFNDRRAAWLNRRQAQPLNKLRDSKFRSLLSILMSLRIGGQLGKDRVIREFKAIRDKKRRLDKDREGERSCRPASVF